MQEIQYFAGGTFASAMNSEQGLLHKRAPIKKHQ
jgi:hypothetical protein